MKVLRLYRSSRILMRYCQTAAEALLNGFWLGVLGPESLSAIDEAYYNESGLYQSRDYNKRGLLKWERRMVEQYFAGAHRLLLIGAGAGRETYALLQLGCQVDAFECNPKLQRAGNEFLLSEGFEPCINAVGRDSCPETREKYDGAIIGWGAYMLIQGSARRIELLRNVKKVLPAGAPILVSFFTRNRDSWGFRATAAIGNVFRTILLRERLEVGDSLAPNFVHYFSESEVARELGDAGFTMASYSSNAYGHAVGHSAIANAPSRVVTRKRAVAEIV